LTLDLGQRGDVSGTEGMSLASEGEKNDEPYKEGERRLEAGHVGSFAFVDARGQAKRMMDAIS
jgi:hypothetical protein